jgi:hypothetical protein
VQHLSPAVRSYIVSSSLNVCGAQAGGKLVTPHIHGRDRGRPAASFHTPAALCGDVYVLGCPAPVVCWSCGLLSLSRVICLACVLLCVLGLAVRICLGSTGSMGHFGVPHLRVTGALAGLSTTWGGRVEGAQPGGAWRDRTIDHDRGARQRQGIKCWV